MSPHNAEFTIYDKGNKPKFFRGAVKPGTDVSILSIRPRVSIDGLGQQVSLGEGRTQTGIRTPNETDMKTIEFVGGLWGCFGVPASQTFDIHLDDNGEEDMCFVVYPGVIQVVAIAKEVQLTEGLTEVKVMINNKTLKKVNIKILPFCDDIQVDGETAKLQSIKIPKEMVISLRITGSEGEGLPTVSTFQTGGTDQADIVFP